MLVEVGLKEDSHPCRALVAKHLAEEKDDPFLGGVERRIAEPGASSADAEAEAALRALADAGENAANVDAIFSWALTVDAACASPVSQLTLAAGLIESGRARSVLLTQSHLATRTFPLSHPA